MGVRKNSGAEERKHEEAAAPAVPVSSSSRRSSGVMKQIAERAGCAVSTVSRVINGKRKNFSVRPEQEQKILQIAMELDYQPNPFLQSMRGGKSKIIGVFDPLHNSSDVMLKSKAEFIREIQRAGYQPVGRYVELHRFHEYSVPFPIVGALLFDIASRPFLSFFERKAIPYVVVNGICLDNGSAVQIDEKANAELLIGELVRHGHRRIAYYSAHLDAGTPFQHYSGILRQQGFDEEVARCGLSLPDGNGDAIMQPVAFLRHHVMKNGVTAVVCYDHERVLQLMHAACSLKLRIPEDFSLVCCDDAPELELLNPSVTGCFFDFDRIGSAAAELLVERMRDDTASESRIVKIPGKLMVRESVAMLQ